ncbi:Acriflavin resistance protein [hydrothermal vent metagenome]|uniref:Acriflavin resistance protein n=1 Tax=hydrothermal vent metagenome TaxID=652676 RepID=A0A3B0ZUI1_9ZZZZ
MHSTENIKNSGQHLGMAGKLARAFIDSPLSPLLLLVSLAIGILGLLLTPRQEDPQISVPMVDIFVSYPGASSQQVSSLVADPLERIMSEIPGVKHVYSASQREQSMITVEFEVGEDMESSLVKLYNKLESNRDRIPPGVSTPLVKPKGVDDVPLVTLTLWSQSSDDATLRLIALEVIQRLKEVKDTSQSFVVGGRSEQIRIEVYPERLSGYGITLDQIANTIRSANTQRGVGQVESNNSSYQLYTGTFLKHAKDVKNLIVGLYNEQPVYLADVAQVIEGPAETKHITSYYTGKAASAEQTITAAPAVTLAIAKKIGSNGVSVANAILDKVEYLKGRTIPGNVNVSVTRNYGATANDKVNELIFKLFIATIVVTILVWFSLGRSAATVVLIVIPVVILVTIFCAWILNFTIDRVSLFALIFSIGILVDDAIVVVENIYRRWLLNNETSTETAIDAVREVGNPTILATFTVIAALLPMAYVSGMMGPYMAPIPALGSVAMLFSLFTAFLFTPWLTMRLKPSLKNLTIAAEKEHQQSEKLERFYRGIITPLIRDKIKGVVFLITLIGIFFISTTLFITNSVRVKMMPLDNKPEFNIIINFPEGTALPTTANLTHRLALMVGNINEVVATQTYVGTASPFNFNGLVRHYYLRQNPWQADIQVQLLHKRDRQRSSHEIAVEARKLLATVAHEAGAKIQIVEMPPGPPVLQSVVAEVYGPNAQTRRLFTKDLTSFFENAKHLDDVDNFLQEKHDVLKFNINREKAQRYGVDSESINRALEMTMGGFILGSAQPSSLLDSTLLVLQAPYAVRADYRRLGDLPIASRTGTQLATQIPLAELGYFSREQQQPIIYHKDLRAVEYVTAETVGRLAAPIYGMAEVEAQLKNYIAPDGVVVSGEYLGAPVNSSKSAFEWAGEWTVTYETFRDMGLAFAVALILIYMLVVWEFSNFILPAIVMAPIPLTLIGIIPGHWLLDAEFTATSMIGFIALAGIIVRNSILLVDFSRQEVNKGVPVQEALIQACKARTRPILITAGALLGGSSVILFDPIFQGMAISLMFGGLISTLLTLLIIPLGCISGRAAFCPASLTDDDSKKPCQLLEDNKKSKSALSDLVFIKMFKNISAVLKLVSTSILTDLRNTIVAFIETIKLALLAIMRLFKQKIITEPVTSESVTNGTATVKPAVKKQATKKNKAKKTVTKKTKKKTTAKKGTVKKPQRSTKQKDNEE